MQTNYQETSALLPELAKALLGLPRSYDPVRRRYVQKATGLWAERYARLVPSAEIARELVSIASGLRLDPSWGRYESVAALRKSKRLRTLLARIRGAVERDLPRWDTDRRRLAVLAAYATTEIIAAYTPDALVGARAATRDLAHALASRDIDGRTLPSAVSAAFSQYLGAQFLPRFARAISGDLVQPTQFLPWWDGPQGFYRVLYRLYGDFGMAAYRRALPQEAEVGKWR